MGTVAGDLPPIALGPHHGFAYDIRYEVQATTQLEAITQATTGLRSALTVRGVRHCDPIREGWWRVVLSVWEEA